MPARHASLPRAFLAAVVVASASGFAPGTAAAHDAKPRHGGIVQEAKDVAYELVVRGDRLVLHVEDHGNPVSTAGASGRATVLAGGRTIESALVPAGDNRLETASALALGPGAKVVAIVALPGKPAATLRFALP